MKPYGHSRTDLFTCRSGCCDTKGSRYKKSRHTVDKTRRKRARRFICDELKENDDE